VATKDVLYVGSDSLEREGNSVYQMQIYYKWYGS